MNLSTFASYTSRGLNPVEEARGMSITELLSLGLDRSVATDLHALADVYFGQTPFTNKQRRARNSAARHSLASLQRIEAHVAKVRRQLDAWNLRVKLCATEPQRVDAVAKDHFKATPKPPPATGVRLTRRRCGVNTLSYTGTALEVADMAAVLASTSATDTAEAFRRVFFTGTDGTDAAIAAVQTNIIIELEDWLRLISGDGEELTFQLTNGATMTGKQYLERRLADCGLITLVDPVAGPVNLYRIARFANWKQRAMISAQFPHCVWPDCNTPADNCQYHHIHSWAGGGLTNLDNLVPLCAYHNGVNEDSGPANTRGKMGTINGNVVWLPPKGGPPRVITPHIPNHRPPPNRHQPPPQQHPPPDQPPPEQYPRPDHQQQQQPDRQKPPPDHQPPQQHPDRHQSPPDHQPQRHQHRQA
ncbi:HNH endonuclease signature motif containing protein [Corynebacterium phocae]|uniref:HNH endonuclease signature motif containing protein n=1 Tax=Corynebacterium phocae TaxID=161895 RepID=UPI00123B18F2|nr:HNH endonuclease signature motif containing protein [Corynebacterium phocae]KAA8721742.1 HNH endonuclease [Corynebacterium phocae]